VAQAAGSLVMWVARASWFVVRRMPKSLAEACFSTNVGQSGPFSAGGMRHEARRKTTTLAAAIHLPRRYVNYLF
jgi:hypothetical protein